MLNLRRASRALWIATALCVALPTSAWGAVTIGSNLAATANLGSSCAPDLCTAAHQFLPETSQASDGVVAPSDGVVVRWRIKVGSPATEVAFRITRPGNSDTRTGAGTGPTVTATANQTSTFQVRLPIRAGDAVGIDYPAIQAFASTPGAVSPVWTPPLVDGGPPVNTAAANLELLVNADIEPDADADGFGDETQDQCPTDSSTQGPCPLIPDTDPPDTEITKGAPNNTDRTKVKFKFTSSEPGSTFECKLDKKAFKPCSSPRKVKSLDEGKHKFQVRAVDAAGNVDPTPAKDKFRVVD